MSDIKKFMEGLNEIDSDLIQEAEAAVKAEVAGKDVKNKKKMPIYNRPFVRKMSGIAACFALLVMGGVIGYQHSIIQNLTGEACPEMIIGRDYIGTESLSEIGSFHAAKDYEDVYDLVERYGFNID